MNNAQEKNVKQHHLQTLGSALLFFISLTVALPAQSGNINYVGSSTIGQFMQDAAQVYTDSTFSIETLSESSGGELCAYRGNCDLGGVARPVNERYLDKGVVATLIGYDAIAAIVNKSNYVKEMTSCQLSGIFSGAITNWKQLGGSDRPIKVYVPKETSGTYKVFKQAVLRHQDYGKVNKITPDIQIVSKVSDNEGAIGQISVALIGEGDSVVPLAIDGEICSIRNQTYPITRPIYLLTNDEPKGEIKAFVDWVLSPAGQDVVKKRYIGYNEGVSP
ncbi:MAG: phosphate ABC transporter substrate-binding protein [Halieaceae bacterium]|nr:phosphate ABC transporter substrate-binding protein [Halieaceae bacterium]